MAELTELLVAAKRQKEKHELVAGIFGIEINMRFPEFVNWVDDGLGVVSLQINYKEVTEEENLKPKA